MVLKIVRAFFDDMIKIEDFDNYNILLDGKSFENILIYDVLNKTFIGAKQLGIIFNKANGFIRSNGES